jgi:4-amino-4-deoxy-L-arabinose transferase-like glycosyltransferase
VLLVLVATTIPAAFTVDDCNYFSTVTALRHGTLFLPGTAELPASQALYAYEPTASMIRQPQSPVPPLNPPLYALLAFPFSFLGWHGLVLLNALAFVATFMMVFAATRYLTGKDNAAWYAAILWALGGSVIEYAQGLWPHLLAVSLTTAGLLLVFSVAEEDRPRRVVTAGALLGLAAGLRYQDSLMLVSGLAVVLCWGRRRWRDGASFSLGALVPFAVSAWMNHARLGSWNPLSKGPHYASLGVGNRLQPIHEFVLTLWTRVVDYSSQPAFRDTARGYLHKLPSGDIVVLGGVLKKSWLQSSPWVLLGLAVVAWAWIGRHRFEPATRRVLRAIAVPIAIVLGVFSLAGIYRHDGLCFNQRYLLELGPLVAVAAGVALASLVMTRLGIFLGLLLGVVAALATLSTVTAQAGFRLQSIVPLVLAVFVVGSWVWAQWKPGRNVLALATVAVTASFAWSATIHFATDLRVSRRFRADNAQRLEALGNSLPGDEPSALIAMSGAKQGFCPLLLDHNMVAVDPQVNQAKDLSELVGALLLRRRVFVWLEGMPKEFVPSFLGARHFRMIRPPIFGEITE